MKIALTGYGKMGHMIEQIAKDRGHEVVCIIDKKTTRRISTARHSAVQTAS